MKFPVFMVAAIVLYIAGPFFEGQPFTVQHAIVLAAFCLNVMAIANANS
jgi:hypothetical protein